MLKRTLLKNACLAACYPLVSFASKPNEFILDKVCHDATKLPKFLHGRVLTYTDEFIPKQDWFGYIREEHYIESLKVGNCEKTFIFETKEDANDYIWTLINKSEPRKAMNIIAASNYSGIHNRRGCTGWIMSRDNDDFYTTKTDPYFKYILEKIHYCPQFKQNQGIAIYKANAPWDSVGSYVIDNRGRYHLSLTNKPEKFLSKFEVPQIFNASNF